MKRSEFATCSYSTFTCAKLKISCAVSATVVAFVLAIADNDLFDSKIRFFCTTFFCGDRKTTHLMTEAHIIIHLLLFFSTPNNKQTIASH